MIGSEGKPPGRGLVARCIRACAQRVLYPLDRLSYATYGILHSRRAKARPFELEGNARRILILSPHQDDELLGCGGFIVKYSAGRSISIAYVTDGKGGAHRTPEAQQLLGEQRRRESREVCRMLGVNEPILLGFEDGKIRGQRLVSELEKLIRTLRPEVIMAPFITDGHLDHAETSMALSRVGNALLDGIQIYLYQVHSHIPDRMLNCYLELSKYEHQVKEQALRLYVSQDMTKHLTLAKYLLFSKMAPQIVKRPEVVSVEHFAMMQGARFREAAGLWNVDELVPRIKSINYSPYSFRNFLRNRTLLDT